MSTAVMLAIAVGTVIVVAIGVVLWRTYSRERLPAPVHKAVDSPGSPETDGFQYASTLLGTSIALPPTGFPMELLARGRPTVHLQHANLSDCRLLFNNRELARASGEAHAPLPEAVEPARVQMLKEHQTRLASTSERRIDLVVDYVLGPSGGGAASHTLNFYYRAGSNRVTPQPYDQSVDGALDVYQRLATLLHDGPVVPEPEPEADLDPPEASSTQVPGPSGSVANELERLVALRQQGLLSDAEFRQAKAKLLDS